MPQWSEIPEFDVVQTVERKTDGLGLGLGLGVATAIIRLTRRDLSPGNECTILD